MSELNCEKDHSHTWWCCINGKPMDPAEAERIDQILKDANLDIIEAVKRREQLAVTAIFRPLIGSQVYNSQIKVLT